MAVKANNAPSLSWWDVTLQLLQIVAAGAALFGWITIVGGARVFARFEAASLPSPVRTVTLVPRDALFAEGLRALWKPMLLGLVAAALVYLVLHTRAQVREQVRRGLDARFGKRYEVHGWANPERSLRSLPDSDAAFARYVQLRREEELGPGLLEAREALNRLTREHPASSGSQSPSEDRSTGDDEPSGNESPAGGTPPALSERARQAKVALRAFVARPWRALLLVAVVAGAITVAMSVLLDVEFVAALAMLVAIPTALALVLLALSRTSGAGVRSFVVFAGIVVIWSLFLLLDEWGSSNPKLDYAFVSLKGREGLLRAVYVARQDGDVYLTGGKDDRVWITMIPGKEIEQLVVAANQIEPPSLPPEVKPEKVKRDDGSTIVIDTAFENVVKNIGPAPVSEPDSDVAGPDILPLARGSARLKATGTFAIRLVRFDERVSGTARFVTRPVRLKDGLQRLPLGVRSFQTEAERAPELRMALSPRVQNLVRRDGSVPVTVRLMVRDRYGNASRMSACITLEARRRAAPRRAAC